MAARHDDEFYTEFTLRNSGFISADAQRRLRGAGILVAGCGSTGGAVVELLVRTGAEHLVLADCGRYELNNINRQNMTVADEARLKVEVFAERCRQINPDMRIELVPDGITNENVADLVVASDIIIDGVDVTTRSGLKAKYALHEHAKRHRTPVISGYDMAGAQYVNVLDYRRPEQDLLDGRVDLTLIEHMEPMLVCGLLVPLQHVPVDMYDELDRQFNEGKSFTSQLGFTANLFGVLAVALTVELLAGRQVKKELYVDILALVRNEVHGSADDLIARRKALESLIDGAVQQTRGANAERTRSSASAAAEILGAQVRS